MVSAGRGVHEALAAATLLAKQGVEVGVVDMPSVDEGLMMELAASGKQIILAEQNNGFLWQNFLKVLYKYRKQATADVLDRVFSISTLDRDGKPQFIHSATYEQLLEAYGLTPNAIAATVQKRLAGVSRKP